MMKATTWPSTVDTVRNQQVLREVNRRVRQLDVREHSFEPTDFLCECGDPDCVETVALTTAEFDVLTGRPGEIVTAVSHRSKGPLVHSTERFQVFRIAT